MVLKTITTDFPNNGDYWRLQGFSEFTDYIFITLHRFCLGKKIKKKKAKRFSGSVIKSMWEFRRRLKLWTSKLIYPQMRIDFSELKVIVTLCNSVLSKKEGLSLWPRGSKLLYISPTWVLNSGTSPLASLPTQRSFHPPQCHTIM